MCTHVSGSNAKTAEVGSSVALKGLRLEDKDKDLRSKDKDFQIDPRGLSIRLGYNEKWFTYFIISNI